MKKFRNFVRDEMAPDARVLMSPVSTMIIHNPLPVAMGDGEEMRRAIQMLDEVKESIINACEIKAGPSLTRLSHLMVRKRG